MTTEIYTQFLFANRTRILLFWTFILAAFGLLLIWRLLSAEVIVNNSVGVWFDLNDQEINAYSQYNDAFGQKEWTILLLKTKTIYDAQFLAELNNLTKDIEKIDNIVKVTSITNVRDNLVNKEGMLNYQVIYPEKLAASTNSFIPAFKEQLFSNPVFDKNLINKNNDQYTSVLIQNKNYIYDQSRYRINIVNDITSAVKKYKTINDWGLAGTTVVNAELNRAAQKDVVVFYTLVSTLLCMISWLMLRSIKDLYVVLAVVVTSVMSTMSLLAILDVPFNMATVMLPPILIALSVACVIHMITDFHIENATKQTQSAMNEALKSTWRPAFWAMLTTVAGLGSFGFSGVNPLFQLGMIGALGVAIAWFTSMTIAPLLLRLLWSEKKKTIHHGKFYFSVTGDSKNLLGHTWLIVGLVIVATVMLLGLHKAEVDTDYSKFFGKNTRVSHSYDLLKDAQLGQNPVALHIKYPSDKEYTDAGYFSATLAFEREVKMLPEVIKMLSVTDLMAEIDKAYAGKALPENHLETYNHAALSQLFFLGELSGNDDLSDLALESRNEVQIIALTPYFSSQELHNFRDKVTAIQKKYLPDDVSLVITGTTVLWANMDRQVTQTQFYSLVFIGLFLTLILPFIFRSITLGILGVIINFLPLAITIGLMSWLGIKINMATVILGAISIGVVVDDTIYMFSRIQGYRLSGLKWRAATEKSLATVGTSIYRTSVILVVAFSCMGTSDFLPTAHLGIFVSISVVIALFFDLLLAPSLIIYFGELKERWSGDVVKVNS